VYCSIRDINIAKKLNVETHNIKNRLSKKELPKMLIWLIAPFVGMQRKFIKNNINYPIVFDNTKSIDELRMEYRSIQVTFDDHIAHLINDNLV